MDRLSDSLGVFPQSRCEGPNRRGRSGKSRGDRRDDDLTFSGMVFFFKEFDRF